MAPALPLGKGTAASCSSALASEGRAQTPCAAHASPAAEEGGGGPFYLFVGSQKTPPSFLPLCLRAMRSPRLLVREDRCRLNAPHMHICTWEAVLAAFVSSGKGSRLRGGLQMG